MMTDALDKVILSEMIAKSFGYEAEIEKQINNLKLAAGSKPIKFLNTFADYKPGDTSTIYVLFSIEGGHAFYQRPGNSDRDIKQIIASLVKFVNNWLVSYITPCHLTPNIFLNHAYGNKLLGEGEFIPRLYGIQPSGSQFLDAIVNEKILIDLKHMSLISRQQFYENKPWNEKPLLCSHAGVTGFSWTHKLDRNIALSSIKEGPEFYKINYRKPMGNIKGTYFNPISINLYDEDIIKIMESKGLIGISMDLRIIGGERNIIDQLKLYEKEFLSKEEFTEWEQQNPLVKQLKPQDYEEPYRNQYQWVNNQISSMIWDEQDVIDEFEELNSLKEYDIENFYLTNSLDTHKKIQDFMSKEEEIDRREEHLNYFVNQLFHIVLVTEAARLDNIDPWEHICIGSDFDGFIRTIDCCKDASELSNFADELMKQLPKLAKNSDLRLRKSPQELIENIFFNNCFNVISKYAR
jgi:microsomal dipeptidase-like Zn-dependent dipeptidase